MLNIILATARPEGMVAFVEALSSDMGVHLKRVHSGNRDAGRSASRLPSSCGC